MPVNELIARGIRPIGADVPEVYGLIRQKQQEDRRNKLIDEQLARESGGRNALSAYLQNPNDQSFAGLAQADPYAAAPIHGQRQEQQGQEQSKQAWLAAMQVANSPSPKQAAMQFPGAIQELREAGVDFDSLNDEQVRQLSQQIAKYHANALGIEQYKEGTGFGNVNPGDFDPASIDRYRQTGNYADLRRTFAPPSVVVRDVGGVPTIVDPGNRTGRGNVQPLSDLPTEAGAERTKAGAGATGKADAERANVYINNGLEAADAIPVVKRGLELLRSVKTGGLDAVKLKATNLFGVTGADEAELSANLGKAVLSQLRATFGAQFTEKEGARLAEIEAGFGKSTEGNKRLLEQAEKILDRAARRGLTAAESIGDDFSASEIRKSMGMDMAGGRPQPVPQGGPKAGDVVDGYRFKGGDPSKQDNWVKQ